MTVIALVASGLALLATALAFALVRKRNMQYWLPSYLPDLRRRLRLPKKAQRHYYFCFADHYEPYGGGKDSALAHQRVDRWLHEYRQVAARHRDSRGTVPQHSFFYPAEEYDPQLLDKISAFCRDGFGDVEVHLHHDNDNATNLTRVLTDFARTLHERHNLLRKDPVTGQIQYCFIHGNWALDNSRPDGRWCGVDNELDVLVRTGCVADLTMPSAPSDTQTRKINSIYFARGCPGARKSHNTGRDVRIGSWGEPQDLLFIQGPLTLNWREGKFGILPRIESAELSHDAPPTAHRVALWGRCQISIPGAEEHIMIKVHTHGATEKSMTMLFDNGGLEHLWTELERQYRDQPDSTLHYVTAWEMVQTLRRLAQPSLP